MIALHLFTTAPTPPGILQESDWSGSCMRVMCLMFAGVAVLFGGMTILIPKAATVGATVTGLFLAAAVGGKVGQKALERPTTPG